MNDHLGMTRLSSEFSSNVTTITQFHTIQFHAALSTFPPCVRLCMLCSECNAKWSRIGSVNSMGVSLNTDGDPSSLKRKSQAARNEVEVHGASQGIRICFSKDCSQFYLDLVVFYHTW